MCDGADDIGRGDEETTSIHAPTPEQRCSRCALAEDSGRLTLTRLGYIKATCRVPEVHPCPLVHMRLQRACLAIMPYQTRFALISLQRSCQAALPGALARPSRTAAYQYWIPSLSTTLSAHASSFCGVAQTGGRKLQPRAAMLDPDVSQGRVRSAPLACEWPEMAKDVH